MIWSWKFHVLFFEWKHEFDNLGELRSIPGWFMNVSVMKDFALGLVMITRVMFDRDTVVDLVCHIDDHESWS